MSSEIGIHEVHALISNGLPASAPNLRPIGALRLPSIPRPGDRFDFGDGEVHIVDWVEYLIDPEGVCEKVFVQLLNMDGQTRRAAIGGF